MNNLSFSEQRAAMSYMSLFASTLQKEEAIFRHLMIYVSIYIEQKKKRGPSCYQVYDQEKRRRITTYAITPLFIFFSITSRALPNNLY